jgi:aerobic-type carbon monoxide dehydrogenase small subunit (CoxS/CutS family)
VCGACTVLVDGLPVRACLLFAVQADGSHVETVESLASKERLSPLQQAFADHHALQCGFCTPGFLMLAVGYLRDRPTVGAEEARMVVSSSLCRCTGYQSIVDAIVDAACRARAG